MTNIAADPAISVLLCTRDRPEHVRRCVPAILTNSFRDFEIVVVDQSGTSETVSFLRSIGDTRLVAIHSRSRGLSRARNIAILASRAPLVAFTDDDCVCDEGWLEEVVLAFSEHPEVAGVFGRVLPWGDRSGEGLYCFHSVIADEAERVVHTVVPPHKHLGHGNNMAFRKTLFHDVGLYNPLLGAGARVRSGEDTDMAYRALRKGRTLMYTPRPLVYHNNWQTLEKASLMDYAYIVGFVAVYGKYYLAGEKTAADAIRWRFRELWEEMRRSLRHRNWKRYRQTCGKLVYFGASFLPACLLRLLPDLPWPEDRGAEGAVKGVVNGR